MNKRQKEPKATLLITRKLRQEKWNNL